MTDTSSSLNQFICCLALPPTSPLGPESHYLHLCAYHTVCSACFCLVVLSMTMSCRPAPSLLPLHVFLFELSCREAHSAKLCPEPQPATKLLGRAWQACVPQRMTLTHRLHTAGSAVPADFRDQARGCQAAVCAIPHQQRLPRMHPLRSVLEAQAHSHHTWRSILRSTLCT